MAPKASESNTKTNVKTSTVTIDFNARRHPSQGAGRRNVQPLPNSLAGFFGSLTRKKPLDGGTETSLNRCLNLLDLTTLGVGSTLGLGLYVLAGQVACNKAGPAVILSFAFAALASAFSALCYAEFAGRVPRAGSAYAYSYITVGEFVAFIIGWNLILEYVIGASSVARGFSGYLRFVFDNVIHSLQNNSPTPINSNIAPPLLHAHQATMTAHHNYTPSISQLETTINGNLTAANLTAGGSLLLATPTGAASNIMDATLDYLIKYFDWLSIAIVLAITIFILVGVKESTNVTLAFTAVNIIVVITVVISSLKSLDLHNWQLSKEELPEGNQHGEGGFLPYGWSGVLAGSATCFFGFIGFDTIASSAEEAKNPKRNVPLAIVLSLFISFVAYMAVAVVQTLLWPYYDQDNVTILPYIFGRLNMPITYWIVLLGAIAGLASSQLGGMYPLPRILYSMAQDKLIYGSLAHVNKRLKLPVRATIVGAFFIALLACLLDIQDLADMVSIGTLAAYSLVSISVLIVRYENRHETQSATSENNHRNSTNMLLNQLEGVKLSDLKLQMVGSKRPVLENGNGEASGKRSQRMGLLDLLTTWRSVDEPTNNKPDDYTARQSRILISTMIILTILLDLVALGFTSTVQPTGATVGGGEQQQQHILARLVLEQSYLQPRLVLICSTCILLFALAAAGLMLSRLPTSNPTHPDMFLVPLVPLVPILSIFVNTFLMLNLSYLTWIRFAVWMSVGFFIYFSYGIWHSEGYMLHTNKRQEIK